MKEKYYNSLFRLVSIAVIIIVIAAFMPIISDNSSAYAASTEKDTLSERIEISNYSEQYDAVSTHGSSITIEGVPSDAKHTYIWLILKDEHLNTVFSLNQTSNGGENLSFYVGSIPDGNYFVTLCHNSKKNGTYESDLHQLLMITAMSGNLYIKMPETASINAKHLSMNHTEKTALDYYIEHSEIDQSVRKQAEAITAGITSDYDKCLAIHDWVADNIYYDYDAYYGKTEYCGLFAADVLKSKRSVCAGYANLTVELLRASGIPAQKVSGYVLSPEKGEKWTTELIKSGRSNHAWTEAYADGRWITMDTTWDSGNKWMDGKVSNSSGCCGHRYFDICSDSFSLSHVVTDTVDYNLEGYLAEKIKIKVKSALTESNGKKAIKLAWTVSGGKLDGFEVFKATGKANVDYNVNCTITQVKKGSKRSYTNSKNLKSGKKYYYKVRGYKLVNGVKIYTPFSNIVYKTVK